jgi:class 3 adenylate cyclase
LHPVARAGFVARVFVYTTTAAIISRWVGGDPRALLAARGAVVALVALPFIVVVALATRFRGIRYVRWSAFVDTFICGTGSAFVYPDILAMVPGIGTLWLSTLSIGGIRLTGATSAVAFGVFGAWRIFAPDAMSAEARAIAFPALFLLFTAYACLIAYSTYLQGKKINSDRMNLEERVAERTAVLASTNAAISRFVPKEFLLALGHRDVTTAQLGDASVRDVSVLFADIRNFTASSENMSPEATFAFLNACLSKLGPHVRAQSGFVDKYIGDAIMALFPRDPNDAVKAAIAMQEELRRSNDLQPNRIPLAIGVGIHVGRVMMGTIGEAERFEATVISDAVNLTARLESLTKQLGCSVLVSDEVHATLEEGIRIFARPLGTFVVKGRSTRVVLHEVFASDDEDVRAAKARSAPAFVRMLTERNAGNLEAALKLAAEIRSACADDGPANWWFTRISRELALPVAERHSEIDAVRLDEK